MSHDGSEKLCPRHRPPSRWNIASASAPFVGFLGGFVAAMNAPHMQWFDRGFRVWLVFVICGTLCAGIALGRSERLRGLTAAGLVLNAAVIIYLFTVLEFDSP
jgi:hypothetical protein